MSTAQKALAGLILDAPFFGALALRLPLIEDARIDTACTDGNSIRYNPSFFSTLDTNGVKFVLAHEVLHVANLHHVRRGGRDPKRWNVAADYAINLLLKESGFKPLDCALIDPAYAGLSTEQIYDRLPEDSGGSNGPGSGNGEGEGDDPGGCGGIVDPTDDNGNTLSEAELQRIAAETQVAVQQAAQAAKAQGKGVSGGLARLVEEVTRPKLDWRDILHSFMQRVKTDQFTWSRPNRRFIGDNLYLPSRDGVELKPIVIAVDTSGSLEDHELAQFSAEVNSILDSFPCEIKVLYVDTEVAGVDTFQADERPIRLNNHGGGGTDFRPAFQWVQENTSDISCLLYFTDLWCNSYPDNHPDYPVLWIATDTGYGNPPFGEVATLR